jgi:hypothetical protein
MDVIGLLCVSLEQHSPAPMIFYNRRAWACSEAGFSSQNGDRAWGSYYRRTAFCCAFFFLWEKGLNTEDTHKEICPVYGGKYLQRQTVHNWAVNVSLMTKRLKRRCGSDSDNSQKTSMLWHSTQLVKRWEKCMNVGGGYVEKEVFFPGSNITCFTFDIHLWAIYWLFLIHNIFD